MKNTNLTKVFENYSYQLNAEIGSGYSSHVFKGHHNSTRQPVAVKVIDMLKIQDDVKLFLLNNEISIIRKLDN